MFVIARSITKGKRAGVSPSRLVEIRAAGFRVGIAKVPCQSGPDFVGELIVVKEVSIKYTVISGDRQWPPRLIRLRCRDLPVADHLVHESRCVSSHPLALSEGQLVHPAERQNMGHIV